VARWGDVTPSNQNKTLALLVSLMVAGSVAPCAAFGGGPAIRSAGSVASGARMQPGLSRGIRGPIFFGADGFTGSSEVTIQQSPAAPSAPAEKPQANRVYVPPRWVDGGYGVEILVPGYWSETEPARSR
jgi:hypothetical protein